MQQSQQLMAELVELRDGGVAAHRKGKGLTFKAPLLLLAGLLSAQGTAAAVTTPLSVNPGQGRGAVIVKTPTANPRGANWALPVVVLLHERCKDASSADSDASFSFSPLVDKVRSPERKPTTRDTDSSSLGCIARRSAPNSQCRDSISGSNS